MKQLLFFIGISCVFLTQAQVLENPCWKKVQEWESIAQQYHQSNSHVRMLTYKEINNTKFDSTIADIWVLDNVFKYVTVGLTIYGDKKHLIFISDDKNTIIVKPIKQQGESPLKLSAPSIDTLRKYVSKLSCDIEGQFDYVSMSFVDEYIQKTQVNKVEMQFDAKTKRCIKLVFEYKQEEKNSQRYTTEYQAYEKNIQGILKYTEALPHLFPNGKILHQYKDYQLINLTGTELP